MECPACNVPLERAAYEHAAVFQCPQCSGYLVQKRRLFLIKSSREQTPEMLEQAAANEHVDSDERIRCPRCRMNRMRKQRVRFGDDGEFQLDVCEDCEQVWFDGGELARYQMSYESSPQAQEAERMERRQRSRTPEQRAEVDERMKGLQRADSFLVQGFEEATSLAGFAVMLVLVIGAWFLGYPLLSGIVSVPLAGLLGWMLTRALQTGRSQIAALTMLGMLEAAYLGYLSFWY